MKKNDLDRRDFLKGAAVGSVAAAGAVAVAGPTETAQAQQLAPAANTAGSNVAGYVFLDLDEAAFVEAVVDHMVPADELTPKGTDLGINIYIDRALAGGWGKGDRLYMQGPWKAGVPSQGYQLPLDACAALSRRNRSNQRALQQDLRQLVRQTRAKRSVKRC